MRRRQAFTDLRGVEHQVKITLAGRRKIRDATEVDLLRAVENPEVLGEVLRRITEDDDFVLTALGAILDIPAETLEAAADSTVYADASTAFVEAIVDFFPASSPLKKPLAASIENGMILAQGQASIMEAALLQGLKQAIGTA
jgi:hypothetical protein